MTENRIRIHISRKIFAAGGSRKSREADANH